MFGSQDFRSKRKQAIMKVRAKVLNATRMWFDQQDYTEVQGPTIIPAVGEWPGYFEVKYFDKKAYLTQGLHPYADAFVASLEKVYTIAPAFRAEKLRKRRHLTEYWRIEAAAKCDFNDIIRVQEELLSHICQSLSKEAQEELKLLRRNANAMEKVKTPFPRLTYDEAIEMLQKDGNKIFWGEKLTWELEKEISLRFDQPFFITDFPVSIETFFYKSNPQRPELTLSVDLLAPGGYGEIAGGGQMIDKKEVLLKKMADEKIESNDQHWYLDLRQYSPVPQAGFVIGLERLIQWICKLKEIREASAFPRTFNSIYP
jgi:asparaginyl-tRNA synthetase